MKPTLKEVQERFQDCLLSGERDEAMLELIGDGARENRQKLLGVYKHAYRARLVEILGNDYPQLHSYLGDQQFFDLARSYIDARPSHFKSARWFGNALPAFIETTVPWNSRREISELATLEQALNSVFDESDEPVRTAEGLAAIAPEEWPALVLRPVRATRRLTFTTNATDIWTALRAETAPPAPIGGDAAAVIVFRHELQSRFRSIGGEEAMMWDEMCRGVRFGDLCEMVAAFGGEDNAALRAAGYLSSWIGSGMIADRPLSRSK